MFKIWYARLQHCVNQEFPGVQAGFRKGRGNRDQIANIRWIIEKGREFQKNINLCFLDYAKIFHCVDHNKLRKALKMGMKVKVAQSCLTLCDSMEFSRPEYWSG